jgi:hypothetical protein
MITRQWHPQHWGLPTQRIRPYHHRQQIKARFIDKDDGALLLLGFFLTGASDALSSA